ncbi:hypothetical protein [Actinophytocola xanthii]|uniref:hypothetical protein n=1 Tax=Actinophytocola xanthii TaxID=1912961 RepID=UPI00117732BC|nr:hypothetical protein [Actinophytocola xanthii]
MTEAPDEASASLAARVQGRRVEAVNLRSETSTTYANPDGSWTLDQSLGPVRVRRDGGWVSVDASLARTGAGTFATRATTATVEVSGGGRTPLVRMTDGAPGSGSPHVEVRNAVGARIDSYENSVTRKSIGNHTTIEYDLP